MNDKTDQLIQFFYFDQERTEINLLPNFVGWFEGGEVFFVLTSVTRSITAHVKYQWMED